MTLTSDLEVLKDIPGYKAILKAVLKSQIQFLVEQLSDHTGEESLLLTACVTDGSLSHLGSNTGRNFIEGHDDVRTMFLSHCLKTGQMVDADEDSDTSIDEPVPVTLHETVSSTVKVEAVKQGTPRQQLLAETRRLMVAQPTTPKPEVTPASRMAQRLGVKRSTSAAEASASPAKAVRVTPAAGHPGTETGGGDLAVAGTSMGEGHPTRAATAGAGGSAKPCSYKQASVIDRTEQAPACNMETEKLRLPLTKPLSLKMVGDRGGGGEAASDAQLQLTVAGSWPEPETIPQSKLTQESTIHIPGRKTQNKLNSRAKYLRYSSSSDDYSLVENSDLTITGEVASDGNVTGPRLSFQHGVESVAESSTMKSGDSGELIGSPDLDWSNMTHEEAAAARPECHLCCVKFRHKYQLALHYDKHHGRLKPYYCEFCNRSFSRKYNMLRHQQMVHYKQNSPNTTFSIPTQDSSEWPLDRYSPLKIMEHSTNTTEASDVATASAAAQNGAEPATAGQPQQFSNTAVVKVKEEHI